jgi:hypothetical protein
MASETGICNAGLIKLGESTITSLSDSSKAARLCNERYAELRDLLLRDHLWQFAIKRLELAQSTTAPIFNWDYAYPLPSDCIRIIEPDIKDFPFKVEGNNIITNESAVYLKYIARVTDPNDFSVSFRECLSLKIAWELAVPLTDNQQLAKEMENRFAVALGNAKAVGSIETPPDLLETESWLESRYAGTSGPGGILRNRTV